MLKFTFQPNFIFFWILLDLLVSVNIHVIKIITWNVVDVWHISFPLILLTFYYGYGLVLLEKYSQIKVLCTDYASNLWKKNVLSFLKLVYQNKN